MPTLEEAWPYFTQVVANTLSKRGVVDGPRPSEDQLARYRDSFPEILLWAWERHGSCSVGQGRYWLCDPDLWQPAADAWIAAARPKLGSDVWRPYLRDAFGGMTLWGERNGCSLMIHPVDGQVFSNDQSDRVGTAFGRNSVMESSLVVTVADELDIEDCDTGKPLFGQALRHLGPLAADQVYAFVPALGLGGQEKLANISIEPAVPHLIMLGTLDADEPGTTGDGTPGPGGDRQRLAGQ